MNGCVSLNKIVINNNNLKSLHDFEYLSSLNYLDMSNNKLTSINNLKKCNSLKYLNISDNCHLRWQDVHEDIKKIETIIV